MQELDAERRMQILRGEIPTPLPEEDEDKPIAGPTTSRKRPSVGDGFDGRERKKRKRYGENDTDFEMRVASEQTSYKDGDRQLVLRKDIDAPLTDHKGHIDLFPQERAQKMVEKNPDAEKEAAKKKKEYEDQYTMRFSNAAGFKQGLEKPWYSQGSRAKGVDEEQDVMPGKDVWGNEDPMRREREAKRIVSSDPLAMMKQGAAQVRQVERERKRWKEEKEKELRELKEAEARKKRHKRRYGDDEDDLEDFSLDRPERSSSRRRSEHDRERRHRHKHSSRSSHRDDRDEDRERRHRHRHHRD